MAQELTKSKPCLLFNNFVLCIRRSKSELHRSIGEKNTLKLLKEKTLFIGIQNNFGHGFKGRAGLLNEGVQAPFWLCPLPKGQHIGDMIKGDESDVRNIDFELQAKRVDKFLCLTIFLKLKYCSYFCN